MGFSKQGQRTLKKLTDMYIRYGLTYSDLVDCTKKLQKQFPNFSEERVLICLRMALSEQMDVEDNLSDEELAVYCDLPVEEITKARAKKLYESLKAESLAEILFQ